MSKRLKIECIQNYNKFLELEEQWETFLQNTDVYSPFLTHGWLNSWLETYGNTKNILIVVVRHKEAIVGIGPFYKIKRKGFKVLELIGTGKSDWLDIPVLSNYRQLAIKEMLKYLLKNRRHWNIINIKDIVKSSPSISILEKVCAEINVIIKKNVRTVSPYFKIEEDWEGFLGKKSSKFRSNLRYYKKKLNKDLIHFNINRITRIQDRPSIIDSMEKVEENSWKVKSGNPNITTKVGKAFYSKIIEYLSERGYLDIWTANTGEKLIAFNFNIIFNNKCYNLNSTFDENYKKLSVGNVLCAEIIEHCFKKQMVEFDFLSGDEPYKYKWCTEHRDIYQIIIRRRTIISLLSYFILIKIRWVLKRSEFFINLNTKYASFKNRLMKR